MSTFREGATTVLGVYVGAAFPFENVLWERDGSSSQKAALVDSHIQLCTEVTGFLGP